MKEPQYKDEFIRKREARRRKQRKRRLKIYFILFLALLTVTAIILSLTVLFPIESITAVGSKVYTGEQITAASGIKTGDNLFAIDRSKVIEKLKTKMPYVETVTFKRQLPGSLVINVKDADEYYCIKQDNSYYTVSKSGWVLEKNDTANDKIFEVIGVKAECAVGSAVVFKDQKTKELFEKISQALDNNGVKTDFIDISDEININIGVEGRFTALIGTSNNTEEKIKHMVGMIEKIPAESGGKINLSMWTPQNTSATFTAKKSD